MRIERLKLTDGRIVHVQVADGRRIVLKGDLEHGFQPTGETVEGGELLAPVAPTAILCIGLNYRRHAAEGNMPIPERPVLFSKGLNTLQHPGQPIRIPVAAASTEVDYECELAVVIGKPCLNATRENALSFVAGYTCVNDVSARDWQLKWGGGQWTRGKSFDTFSPLGPALVTPDSLPDPNKLRIRTILNGVVVQDWNTDDMIFDVRSIIAFLSQSTTLLPGTVILTGTPHGVGMARKPPLWLKEGDVVTIDIESIGELTNPVALEQISA